MIIGKFVDLTVAQCTSDGWWLLTPDQSSVYLPATGVAVDQRSELLVGTVRRLFIDSDPRGQPVATWRIPRVEIGHCASLRVVTATDQGAWLDWGLEHDLYVPRSEIKRLPAIGSYVFVIVYQDPHTGRLAGSTRLHRFLSENGSRYRAGQSVSLTIAARSHLGFKAVVDDSCLGLLHESEVFQPLQVGDRVTGFVQRVRPDGKLDLTLRDASRTSLPQLNQRILEHLKAHGGRSEMTDRTPPEQIYATFQVSKKTFKRALSALYKARLIDISEHEIRQVER